jgi:type IV pilus assembly protein PilW
MAGVNPSQPDRSTVSVGNNLRGNSVPLHNTLTNGYNIRGCSLKFSDITSATTTSALTCGHTSSSTGPDSIAIAYEADRYNTIATGTGVPTDCMGSGITPMTASYTASNGTTTATATIYEAENRFYVGTSTNVVNPTLYCKGNASTNGQPLIENIEDLQFTYGTSNPASTPTKVLGYLSAYEVDNDATTLTGTAGSASRWNAVKTVRICVLARSENPVLDTISSAKYMNCAGTLVTNPPDKRLRRAYTTTVVLRNQ